MGESETGESGWTKANLQKLLAAMKTRIPEQDRMRAYISGLKTMDWNEVAFPPFSPEACREKMRQILHKMRKIRTLTELIVEAEDLISNPVTNLKNHPEHPKRPAPPNAIFLEENAATYQKKHPRMRHQKLFKKLIKKYQKLPDEEKAQYVEKFNLANDDYRRSMQVFSKQYQNNRNPERKTYRKKRSANTKAGTEDTEGMPQKPSLSGYKLFCKEQPNSKRGSSGKSCVTVWAQSWRDMTEKHRDEYNTRSTELKRQYVVELNEYLMNFDEEKQKRILKENGIKRPKVSKGIKKRDIKKFPGEPKMPSRSGYGIFCKNQMVLLREKFPNSRDRFAVICKMWQDLNSKEKERYKKEVFEDNKKHSVELQKWFETLPAAEKKSYQKHNPSKVQYLDVSQMEVYDLEEPCVTVYRPSDSEDEDLDDSSDEEEDDSGSEEVEDEDSDVITFEVL
ncbi:nucleolar transcription factor 1-A-like [Anoplopoma fimbria]|uniref:nucleolar transcription factor 1-A-like n=1 Tax=Anoplopoma fimbria TaxID=229290 RepID=UPI0023EAD275|nr:nucleolar transcription factor 1-A-like [Anoplopoma fimbria]XP_054455015.1 nucleolar transcription factor 1-A-like [Anoplopoma fimbria]XP_054455016.1 nucleolar transcription factor 1-A-like [Anoplopoma fimbria]